MEAAIEISKKNKTKQNDHMQRPIIQLMAHFSPETREIRRYIQNAERKSSPLRMLHSVKLSFKNRNENKQDSLQVDLSYMKFESKFFRLRGNDTK